MNFIRCVLVACLACLCLIGWAAPTVLVEGQRFEQQMRVAGGDLLLNGTGVRAVAWFKGYAAGLYVQQRADTAQALLAQRGPKRLQLRMLQDVPAAEFVKALRKGMARNAGEDQHAVLQERVDRFAALIISGGAVKKGDVIDLDWDPSRGMLFSRNGTLRGEAIGGADFYGALLLSFVGDKPYDEALKAGLLGRTR
jgi:Chalcone isomerase-like